ncbi:MAG: hypothetical protein QGF90_07015 [Gammaproteobacteria bacterium]|nr:hypothetical protein [Gammaproteobacteria bacterium]
MFSYDARFLLTVLPFYAVLTGKGISDFWLLLSRYGYGGLRHSAVRHTLVMLIAGVGITQARLGGSIRWLTHHNATYAERLTRAKGDLYPAVEYLRDQTDPESRTYSTDGRITFYLIERPITVGYPLNTSELQGYDYFVVGSWAKSVYNALGLINHPLDYLDEMENFQRVYTGPLGELSVYRVLNP